MLSTCLCNKKLKEVQISEGKEAPRKVFFEKLYTHPRPARAEPHPTVETGFAVRFQAHVHHLKQEHNCLRNTFLKGEVGILMMTQTNLVLIEIIQVQYFVS